MNEQLQNTLNAYVHPGWQSNPAMQQIIDGYAKFHAVLAVVAGLFLLLFLAISIRSWVAFKRTAKIRQFKWPFEKKVYFCFAILFTFVALFMALITVANITNATKPLPGFVGSTSSMTTNNYNRQLHASFNEWIVSGKATPPSLVQQRIHHRRVFHTVRAGMGIVLLVLSTYLSIRIWKKLIRLRNSSETKWNRNEAAMFAAGIAMVLLALYAVLVVMANLQSAIAPIANALQFG